MDGRKNSSFFGLLTPFRVQAYERTTEVNRKARVREAMKDERRGNELQKLSHSQRN